MTQELRRTGVALGLAVLAGALSAQPAEAQDRMEVLVVNLQAQNGANDKFGREVAEDLKEFIDDMATHQPVEKDDLKDALKKFKLDEKELDCIKGRQLAIQMGWGLVLCGTYDPQNQMTAQFTSAQTGESYTVPPFQASSEKQAAQQIAQSFTSYIDQLRYAVFCNDAMQQENYATALEHCNRALSMNPELGSALYGKGRALMEMDSLRGSLETFQKLLTVSPANQDAMLAAGIVAAKLNDKDAARDYFADYLELNPGNIDVRLQVATDLANAGDPEGALRIAQEGLQSDTSNNLTLRQYVGDFALNAAMQAREGGANGEPTDPTHAMGLFSTALEQYRAVFTAKGDSADPRMLRNMLTVLVQLEQHDEAAELGREVVAVKADDPQIWFTYASALQKTGDTAGAIDALRKVTELEPGNTNAYKAMAIYLVQADRLNEAREVIGQAVQNVDASQRDALSDDLAKAIFAEGYNEKYKKGQPSAAREYWTVARSMATTGATRSMVDFWRGFSLYEQAQKVQEPNTAASAKQALPMFQEARQLIQSGQAYAATQPSVPFQKIMDAIAQFVEIQELLIKRGR